jgi:hypothetical protein
MTATQVPAALDTLFPPAFSQPQCHRVACCRQATQSHTHALCSSSAFSSSTVLELVSGPRACHKLTHTVASCIPQLNCKQLTAVRADHRVRVSGCTHNTALASREHMHRHRTAPCMTLAPTPGDSISGAFHRTMLSVPGVHCWK